MSKNILFVSHDASRTGAPMVLLHFVKWIKHHTDCRVTVLLKENGPLLAELEKIGSIHLWRPGLLSGSIKRRIRSKIKGQRAYVPFPAALEKEAFDMVYLNTVDTLHLAPAFKKKYNCPVIAHVHEHAYSVQAYYPQSFTQENTRAIDHYIAVSNSVADDLKHVFNIPKEKVDVFNEFVSIADTLGTSIAPASINEELGITGKFVVGAAGKAGWRKGTDLFIRLAAWVNKLLPENNVVFVWVGYQSEEAVAQSAYEIRKFDLQEKVIFTGSKNHPQNYYQVFDIFALTSREDPFPLVSIEAGALKKPVFCFEKSGGIPDIITEETGKTFAYGDVKEMAEGIIDASRQPEMLIKMGDSIGDMMKRYDVNVIAPRLFNAIISVTSR